MAVTVEGPLKASGPESRAPHRDVEPFGSERDRLHGPAPVDAERRSRIGPIEPGEPDRAMRLARPGGREGRTDPEALSRGGIGARHEPHFIGTGAAGPGGNVVLLGQGWRRIPGIEGSSELHTVPGGPPGTVWSSDEPSMP